MPSNSDPAPVTPGPSTAFPLAGVVEVVAHRGYSARAPENTLSALRLAIDAGADAVEFDLHATADAVPVLLHDATLDRTTDATGRLADRPLEALRGVDAGRWFSEDFTGEPVPTLEAALAEAALSGVRVYAEVKRSGVAPEALVRTVELVVAAGLLSRTVFISMEWAALEALRAAAPEALIGYIVERPRRAEEAIERAGGDSRALVDFDARILLARPHWAERAASAGVPLATWTVDRVDRAERLLGLGVPRITTNEVGAMVAWKRSLADGGG